MSRHRLRVWIVAALVIAFTAVSAIVFAEWLATGTGEGNAAAGTAAELRVLPGSSVGAEGTQLIPGGTGDVIALVQNDNWYPIEVREFAQDGPITSDQPGCDETTGQITFTTQTGSWVIPPINEEGELLVFLTDALAMGTDAANQCQGAEFTVPLAVTGGSHVGASTTTTAGPAPYELDLMLVMDESETMADDITALWADASLIVDALDGRGPEGWAKYGLIGFGGDHNRNLANARTPLVDGDAWLSATSSIPIAVFDALRPGLDAVVMAMDQESMLHRPTAMTCVVVVSDRDADIVFHSYEEALASLQALDAQLLGLVDGGPETYYPRLAVDTDGWYEALVNGEASQTPARILELVDGCLDRFQAGS